jgi:hypothetical protein
VNNDAWSRGEINLPIEEDFGQKYPILQYADNSIMIMLADQTQLLHLKEILANFSASTGLHVSYNKTILVPINIDQAQETLLPLCLDVMLRVSHSHIWAFHWELPDHQW